MADPQRSQLRNEHPGVIGGQQDAQQPEHAGHSTAPIPIPILMPTVSISHDTGIDTAINTSMNTRNSDPIAMSETPQWVDAPR